MGSPGRGPSEEQPRGPQAWVLVFLTSWNYWDRWPVGWDAPLPITPQLLHGAWVHFCLCVGLAAISLPQHTRFLFIVKTPLKQHIYFNNLKGVFKRETKSSIHSLLLTKLFYLSFSFPSSQG